MYSRAYLHIPFCLKKCAYCSFFSQSSSSATIATYVELLCQEIRIASLEDETETLRSIYLGGGTPSLLAPEQLQQIMATLRQHLPVAGDAEITLEVNPGTVNASSLREFRSSGINRLSLGVQSFDDRNLAALGRIHTVQQAGQAYEAARCSGFDNISIDLMYGLPGQQLAQWHQELVQAIRLAPEHLSVYGLTLEEGTVLYERYGHSNSELPDQDLAAEMYELTGELLGGAGFEQYEFSNYARTGFRSDHNCGYWQRDGYLGLGAGAHSFRRQQYGIRWSNVADLAKYAATLATGTLPRCDREVLTCKDAMAEFLFLGLRMLAGVSMERFRNEFGLSMQQVYGQEIGRLEQQGLLCRQGDLLALTLRGRLLSNQVLSCFVS